MSDETVTLYALRKTDGQLLELKGVPVLTTDRAKMEAATHLVPGDVVHVTLVVGDVAARIERLRAVARIAKMISTGPTSSLGLALAALQPGDVT